MSVKNCRYCPTNVSLGSFIGNHLHVGHSTHQSVGADVGNVICFARNFLVVDLESTPKSRLGEHQLRNLNEIKDALTEYLKEDTNEATK